MFIYLKIALKGFLKFRKKRKHLTLVLIGAFFLSFFLMNFFNSMFNNIHAYWGQMLLGEYTIVQSNYEDYKFLKPPRKEHLYSFNDLEPILNEMNGITYSKRLRFFSMLESHRDSKRQMIILVGAEAEKEQKILTNLRLMEGRWPEEGKKEICLFLSTTGGLQTSIGDCVIVYTQNVDGYMDYDLVRLTGILEPKEVQTFYPASILGFTSFSFAKSIKNAQDKDVTETILSDVGWFDKMKLSYHLPRHYKIVDLWNSEAIPLTMYWICMFILIVLLTVISIIVFSVVYHNLHLMIIERYREIGVFLTFGASKTWLLKTWGLELFLYTLYCSAFGLFFSIMLILGFNALEIKAMSVEMEIFLSASRFTIFIDPMFYFIAPAVLFLIVLTASAYPFIKGVNEDVVVKLFRK